MWQGTPWYKDCQAKSQAALSSAAASTTISVAGAHEVFEELSLRGNRELWMAAAEMFDVGIVIRHAGDFPQDR